MYKLYWKVSGDWYSPPDLYNKIEMILFVMSHIKHGTPWKIVKAQPGWVDMLDENNSGEDIY